MAISRGTASTEGSAKPTSTANLIGIANVRILCVNPTMEEYNEILHFQPKETPNYVSEQIVDGQTIKTARITFWVELLPEHNSGVSGRTTLTFWIRSNVRYNNDKSKVQVIDKYGATTWVTIEQAKKREVPVGPYGPMVDAEYKGCHAGEEELVNFLKNYLNLPSKTKDPVGASITLDEYDKYFAGDFKELKEALTFLPNNTVQVLLGVKTGSDNIVRQDFYTNWFGRGWYNSENQNGYARLLTKLNSDKAYGRYANSTFDILPVKEYVINASVESNAQIPMFGGAAEPKAQEVKDEDDGLPF